MCSVVFFTQLYPLYCVSMKIRLIQRAENRLKMSENRVLMRILPKMQDVRKGWKELHIEELHNFYSLSSFIILSS